MHWRRGLRRQAIRANEIRGGDGSNVVGAASRFIKVNRCRESPSGGAVCQPNKDELLDNIFLLLAATIPPLMSRPLRTKIAIAPRRAVTALIRIEQIVLFQSPPRVPHRLRHLVARPVVGAYAMHRQSDKTGVDPIPQWKTSRRSRKRDARTWQSSCRRRNGD